MAIVLLEAGGGGDGSVAVRSSLYVKGDDDGLWYGAGMGFDSVLGIYLWSTGGPLDLPDGTVNLSDRVIGPSFSILDAAGSWHRFNLVANDPQSPQGYLWTDADQSPSTPAVHRIRDKWRADDGLYIMDVDGNQIHKMGITGGLWAELNQGYSIPL